MSDWAKDRRQMLGRHHEAFLSDAGCEPNRRLAQIAALLDVPVSRLIDGISPRSDEHFDQCILMMSLFGRIGDPAARAKLIAAARDVLGEAGRDD